MDTDSTAEKLPREPDEGYGALQRNPQNARRGLDLFLAEKK
jgi:hypothetical protein